MRKLKWCLQSDRRAHVQGKRRDLRMRGRVVGDVCFCRARVVVARKGEGQNQAVVGAVFEYLKGERCV